jgi:hypothetical protein
VLNLVFSLNLRVPRQGIGPPGVVATGKGGRRRAVAIVPGAVETVLDRAFLARDDECDSRRRPDDVPGKNTEEDRCDKLMDKPV